MLFYFPNLSRGLSWPWKGRGFVLRASPNSKLSNFLPPPSAWESFLVWCGTSWGTRLFKLNFSPYLAFDELGFHMGGINPPD